MYKLQLPLPLRCQSCFEARSTVFLVVVMGIGYISSQFLNRIILDNFSPYWCFAIYQSFVISSLLVGSPDCTSSRFTSVNCGSDSLKHDQKSPCFFGSCFFFCWVWYSTFFFSGLVGIVKSHVKMGILTKYDDGL